MSAATQTPIVPPRPIKAQDTPKIPPRPTRRAVDRSLSPSRDRFAPSPLDSLLSKSPNRATFPSLLSADPIDRSSSVELPSVGQEGMEYEAAVEELSAAKSQAGSSRAASPEHTRTVGEDLKLHAPKPSLPAISAKQRVATVTRTDSDKAASYGIGQPSGEKKKGSTTSQELSEDGLEEDEHGIPEIGRQVPMYPNAGDVQAPSPAPESPTEKKHHNRKKSARGFGDLPPGSYGLHGHGVIPSDKLEQAYYGKHPELVEKEHTPHHSDRTQDYSMTSDDLNKIVRQTSRGTGIGAHDINGTPSEQVGWQAIDESISRPASVAPKGKSNSFGSQSSATKSGTPGISFSAPPEDDVIHVDDPSNRRRSVMFSEDEGDVDYESEAPILAADEVAKDPSAYDHEPAVVPACERRLSSYDGDEASSRPSSRPASMYRVSSIPEESAIAVDKADDDYEPLFKDDKKPTKATSVKSFGAEDAPRFPSRDIWEDAPNSAHFTAEVSTPDMPVQQGEQEGYVSHRPTEERDTETPAQKFARQQEELAEKELLGADAFAENRKPHKPTATTRAKKEVLAPAGNTHAPSSSPAPASVSSLRRPQLGQRFPSRDVWEDAPESLQLQTVVSNPQEEEEVPSPIEPSKPQVPQRSVRKSSTDPSDKAASPTKPPVSDKPKPIVPARPVRQQAASPEDSSPPKAKPTVPARPFGGKIAQLQANFMSDLNKKLKIGPQALKKEEPAEAVEEAPEAEKAPLVDARKGRARGPQRSAPRAAAATSAPAAATSAPAAAAPLTLAFSTTTTLYSINPDDGGLIVTSGKIAEEAEAAPEPAEAVEEKVEPVAAAEEEKPATAEEAEEAASVEEASEPGATEEAAAEE
ncbi:hypothetical protein SEUCBS139899_007228 [Sporothrix eucalyptigena]|uniref:Altered inheritance of mitochondria protein 21 n=1 Tax=Sporothrix eucalyptigena TaxID=1812306 RepID=A0ABP0B6Y0_9PEZI